MKKERKVIESNATIFFDRNVNVSELSLPSNFEGDIIVNGMLYFDKSVIIKCDNLYAKSVVSDGAYVSIIGNVFTVSDINVYDITVNGSIYCQGDIYATNLVVSEDCTVKDEFYGDSHWMSNIEVCGDFTAKVIRNVFNIMVSGTFSSKLAFGCNEVEVSIGVGQ